MLARPVKGCKNLGTNGKYCGAGTTACDAGESCCSEVCADPQTSSDQYDDYGNGCLEDE